MKAVEAAEHSDVIIRHDMDVDLLFYKRKAWFNGGGEAVDITDLDLDYVPLVPKKIYKVGDKVTFLEALNSGMCFRLRNEATIQKFDGKLKFYDRATGVWRYDDNEHVNSMSHEIYTLCEDPSIPPKPTLESLPVWTRCKVVLGCAIFDVVKMPGTGGPLFYRDKYGILTNSTDNRVKLLSVYNPKTEQWEDV